MVTLNKYKLLLTQNNIISKWVSKPISVWFS